MNSKPSSTRTFDWTLGVAGVAASGLVAGLVFATVGTAAASQPRDLRAPAAEHGTRITTACHITPHTWNVSLDGPTWRCYRYLP